MDKKITAEEVGRDAVRVVQDMVAGRDPHAASNQDFDPALRAATAAYFDFLAADSEYNDAAKAVSTAASLATRIAAEEAKSKALAAREAARGAYSAHLK